jgi:hypothetical protein
MTWTIRRFGAARSAAAAPQPQPRPGGNLRDSSNPDRCNGFGRDKNDKCSTPKPASAGFFVSDAGHLWSA